MPTPFADLLPEVLPDVPGCADLVAERAIRNAAIRFCQESKLYRQDLTPINVVADEPEYTVTPPAGYALVDIRRALFDGQPLYFISQDELDRLWNDATTRVNHFLTHDSGLDTDTWQTATSSRPKYFFQPDKEKVRLVGIPTVAVTGGLELNVALKPTPTATQIEDWLYNDHFRTLAFGALGELLKIPQKPWTDKGLSDHYESLFREGIGIAKGEALRDHGRNDRVVGRVRSYV